METVDDPHVMDRLKPNVQNNLGYQARKINPFDEAKANLRASPKPNIVAG